MSQSVRDALADAQTLALTVRELRTFEYTSRRKTKAGRLAEAIGGIIYRANMAAGSARFQASTRETWAADGYHAAREAAHEAFRAIPSLRGEQ